MFRIPYSVFFVLQQDGAEIGWEEYYDYSFPDDEKKVMGFKILENAMKWKLAAAAALHGTSCCCVSLYTVSRHIMLCHIMSH